MSCEISPANWIFIVIIQQSQVVCVLLQESLDLYPVLGFVCGKIVEWKG